MLILSQTSVIRIVTSPAAQIEVHASVVDIAGTVVSVPDPVNTPHITTATTTTVVPSPGAGVKRNVKHLNITNDHASASCSVTVEHFDGTTAIELMAFILLPGENMIFNEEGRWAHRDAQGAEYPPAGFGDYGGYSVSFLKATTAPDAAGYWYCTSKDGGSQGAWSPGTPGVNGRVTDGTLTADNGCVTIKNPAVGANYLMSTSVASGVTGTHQFFDVLWVNTGLVVTTTTAQAFTVPTLPARDINGTTSGEGCSIGLLCTSASGLAAVASNATITYTNSKGVAGRVATLSPVVGSQAPATPVAGTIIWFNLAAGDTGVQAGSWSITLGTTWVSGTISLMIVRDIEQVGVSVASVSVNSSGKTRLYNGTTMLHCIMATAPTGMTVAATLNIAER